MSTPQVEDGYTKLANELLEALIRAGLSKREWVVVMTVVRKTYGFNKKVDDMTLTQIANMSGMDLAHVSRTVGGLAESNILLKRQGTYGYVLGINKNYRQWMTCQNGNLAKTASEPCQNGNNDLPKRQPQKTTPKDTTKRQSAQIGIKKFLDQCKAEKIQPVPPEDPVFKYADKTGIPHDWLHLCWLEFVERSIESGKRYADWRAAFRNCVRSNWYKLWWAKPEGDMGLTTTGVMAQRKHSQEAVNG